LLLVELSSAKERFNSELDLKSALDGSFRDVPLPSLRAHPGVYVVGLGLFVAFVVGLIIWPSNSPTVFVPEKLELALLVQRDGAELRRAEPEVSLRGGDRLRVEVSIPTKQIMSILVLEKDGSLTPLATGRLFHPGRHVLPQTLFVDERRPLVARLVAGAPVLVRTATTSGGFDAVLSIRLRPEPPRPPP
jgi:hypothetical protein